MEAKEIITVDYKEYLANLKQTMEAKIIQLRPASPTEKMLVFLSKERIELAIKALREEQGMIVRLFIDKMDRYNRMLVNNQVPVFNHMDVSIKETFEYMIEANFARWREYIIDCEREGY